MFFMGTKFKHWRLNVIVNYAEPQLVVRYRPQILDVLRDLASIYKLDYAISEQHKFVALPASTEEPDLPNIFDLVYFRSNEHSRIVVKNMRSVIDCMFGISPSPFSEEVEVSTQLYKVLPRFPFPLDFYRPLNYPYIEVHKGNQVTLYVYADEVMKLIESKQNYPLN